MKGPSVRKTNLIAIAVALVVASGGGAFGQMRAAAPGPVHKQLARRAGEYTTVTRFTAQPGAAPVDSNGTAKLTLILDGRFLLEEDAGIFMGEQTIDDNHFVVGLYAKNPDGSRGPAFETTFTRKK